MSIHVPAKHNERLGRLLDLVNADVELMQLYRCANINAVDRSGMNDHGEVHVRIVANAALRVLRLLLEGDVVPGVVANYEMENDDAEVVVVLAACLHDIGIAVNRDDHERHSLIMAYPKARQLLADLYTEPALTIMVAEVLHAVVAHNWSERCLTVEAGVVKVADALDMTQGRSRIPFESGKVNIHSVSALAVREVRIVRGESRPVRIAIELDNPAGIFQIDELLKRKLGNSSVAPFIEVVATIEGESESKLLTEYML